MMFRAKLANLATHDQRERQDERHVRILIRRCAHYLADACAAVQAGNLTESGAVERFMATYRVIAGETGVPPENEARSWRFERDPRAKLAGKASELRRIRAFDEHQIEG